MKKDLIGKKVRGFKFNPIINNPETNDLGWNEWMERYIDKIGIIKDYLPHNDSYVVDFNGTWDSTWNYPASQIEQHLVNENEINKMKTIKVKKSDLKKIHEIACTEWQGKIWGIAERDVFSDTVEMKQSEIDEMFKAATSSQRTVLVAIFGEPKKEIDFTKIKTGSKVMIEYSGQHCSGIDKIDLKKPVDVVFYKTSQYITGEGKFFKASTRILCTFHQDGKYALFAADENTDYITEVIEY